MTSPLVTVVIPAYNARRWVAAAIESVLGQRYTPFEVVVVDDGSKDGTEAVVRGFGDRVRYVHQANAGVCLARNRGAAAGSGTLVAFLDADDLWLPGKLKAQAERFEAVPELAACFTRSEAFEESTGLTHRFVHRLRGDPVEDLLRNGNVIGQVSSLMVRRDVFERLGGFDPLLSNCADWDIAIRLVGAGPVELVEEDLVRYRIHAGSMSTSVPLLEKDTLALLDKFFSDGANAAKYAGIRGAIYASQYLTLSGSYLHSSQLGPSLRFLAKACAADPRSLLRALGMPARVFRRLRAAASGAPR